MQGSRSFTDEKDHLKGKKKKRKLTRLCMSMHSACTVHNAISQLISPIPLSWHKASDTLRVFLTASPLTCWPPFVPSPPNHPPSPTSPSSHPVIPLPPTSTSYSPPSTCSRTAMDSLTRPSRRCTWRTMMSTATRATLTPSRSPPRHAAAPSLPPSPACTLSRSPAAPSPSSTYLTSPSSPHSLTSPSLTSCLGSQGRTGTKGTYHTHQRQQQQQQQQQQEEEEKEEEEEEEEEVQAQSCRTKDLRRNRPPCLPGSSMAWPDCLTCSGLPSMGSAGVVSGRMERSATPTSTSPPPQCPPLLLSPRCDACT